MSTPKCRGSSRSGASAAPNSRLLTYLVIYVQNVLGYSAVATGVRFLFLSGAAFVAAAIAGRLTSVVPVKWLIGPGFLVLGVGLLLVRGIETGSSWTHLIPGLLVSGVGIGMINPPLASTAVGVVSVDRSGMASGINSTLRQVGIATGIAALGSIFSTQVADGVAEVVRQEREADGRRTDRTGASSSAVRAGRRRGPATRLPTKAAAPNTNSSWPGRPSPGRAPGRRRAARR